MIMIKARKMITSRAGFVYEILLEREGEWISAWDLAKYIHSLSIATVVSQARLKCGAGERIENKLVHKKNNVKHSFYRLVK